MLRIAGALCLSACVLGNLRQDPTSISGVDSGLSGRVDTSTPNRDPTPDVSGSAPAGSAVSIFTNADCAGDAAVITFADELGSFSTTVVVPQNTTTQLSVSIDGKTCVLLGVYTHDDKPPAATLSATPAVTATPATTLSVQTEAGASSEVFAGAMCAGTALVSRSNVPLATNTSNAFSARATDEAGNVSACASIQVVHDDLPPVVGATASQFALSWQITESGSGLQSVSSCASSDPAVCTFSSEALQESGTHNFSLDASLRQYFRVRAQDAAGNSADSALVSARALVTHGNVLEVSVGHTHACARMGDGTVQCWGSRANGELGGGVISATPSPSGNTVMLDATTPLRFVTDIDAGKSYTCASNTSGKVFCWGQNTEGVFGTGSMAPTNSAFALQVPGLSDIKSVAAGDDQVCALHNSGNVSCWGANLGPVRVGRGTTGATGHLSPGHVQDAGGDLSGAIAIASGQAHSCAVLDNGGAECWGLNNVGQMGASNTTPAFDTAQPVIDTPALASAIDVFGSAFNSCFRLVDGHVKCTGGIVSGQIGFTGPTGNVIKLSNTVLSETGSGQLSNIIDISGGTTTHCAVRTSGDLFCWGSNFNRFASQTAPASQSITPFQAQVIGQLPLVPMSNIMKVSVGNSASCALSADGEVSCWGDNASNIVSSGGATNNVITHEFLPTQLGVRELTAGDDFSCALTADGAAHCWGDNSFGQLGVSGITHSTTPVRVNTSSKIRSMAAGARHLCIITGFGATFCQGDNRSSQLLRANHTSTPEPLALSPVAIPGGTQVSRSIAAGGATSCLTRGDGLVFCGGANDQGQLARGNTGATDTVSSAIASSKQMAVGRRHACSLHPSGITFCWGDPTDSALGRAGSPLSAGTGPLGPYTGITAGEQFTCTSRSDGQAECWGRNDKGQTGTDAAGAPVVTPTLVVRTSSALTGVHSVIAGRESACVLRRNNTSIRCWGSNVSGMLTRDPVATPFISVAAQYFQDAVGDQDTNNTATSSEVEMVTQVALGSAHSVVFRPETDVMCAGDNSMGQLGRDNLVSNPFALKAPHEP